MKIDTVISHVFVLYVFGYSSINFFKGILILIVQLILTLMLTSVVYCTITTLFGLCLNVVLSNFLCERNTDIDSQFDADTDTYIGIVLQNHYFVTNELEFNFFSKVILILIVKLILILVLKFAVYHIVAIFCSMSLNEAISFFLFQRYPVIKSWNDSDTDTYIGSVSHHHYFVLNEFVSNISFLKTSNLTNQCFSVPLIEVKVSNIICWEGLTSTTTLTTPTATKQQRQHRQHHQQQQRQQDQQLQQTHQQQQQQ
jgi:hypothetical protein